MTKERTSLSLDPEVNAHLQREDVNASGTVNNLVKKHINGGVSEEHMLKLRIEQVESELESLENRVGSKRNELESLRARFDDMVDSRESILEEAAKVLSRETLEPDNPAVENWAAKAGMSEHDFIEVMKERL